MSRGRWLHQTVGHFKLILLTIGSRLTSDHTRSPLWSHWGGNLSKGVQIVPYQWLHYNASPRAVSDSTNWGVHWLVRWHWSDHRSDWGLVNFCWPGTSRGRRCWTTVQLLQPVRAANQWTLEPPVNCLHCLLSASLSCCNKCLTRNHNPSFPLLNAESTRVNCHLALVRWLNRIHC